MTSLDFQQPFRAGDVVAYRRFEQPGWIALPRTMEIGRRADGSPDFQIDLVRARDASLAGYGAIDFRAVPAVALGDVQRAVDTTDVRVGEFGSGWLRLLIREPGRQTATRVVPPIAIASNGLGAFRLAATLTADAASLLKNALLQGLVLAEAWAEMRVDGIAPRVAGTVDVDGDRLRRALPPMTSANAIRRSDVVAALVKPGVVSGLPAASDPVDATEAIADRLRVLAGTFVPSPDTDVTEWWQLTLGAGETRLRWDLREAVAATRIQTLRFDPFALVRQALERGGLDRLIATREVIDLRTGDVPVLVTANLPDTRTPILSCGVDLDAPARLPDRPAAIRETVELVAPLDRQEVVLRFSANEAAEYGIQTFAIVQTAGGLREWRSTRDVRAGRDLRLTTDDFDMRFIPVTASPQLVEAGVVSVSAAWGGDSQVVLLGDRRTDTLVVPRSATVVRCTCLLTRDGRTVTADVPLRDGALSVDLGLFREFGPHTVSIEVAFAPGSSLVALEVKPEAADDRAALVLSFTPVSSVRQFTWLAASPFAPGFRFRPYRTSGALSAWSDPQSAFDTLRLDAAAFALPGQPA